MISESIELLNLWNENMSITQFKEIASKNGVLGKTTQLRLFDIINNVFVPRFLINDQKPAKYLKRILLNEILQPNIRLILFLYTCRAQKILFDFQCKVYWGKYYDGSDEITKTDIIRFIEDAIRTGLIKKPWSNSSIDRVSRSILKTLADFQFIEQTKTQSRRIQTFSLDPFITKYLAHDIHFTNVNDNSILTHPDWLLFGITEKTIINELERASYDNTFIVQYSGELLRISWRYETMEDFIDAQGR